MYTGRLRRCALVDGGAQITSAFLPELVLSRRDMKTFIKQEAQMLASTAQYKMQQVSLKYQSAEAEANNVEANNNEAINAEAESSGTPPAKASGKDRPPPDSAPPPKTTYLCFFLFISVSTRT